MVGLPRPAQACGEGGVRTVGRGEEGREGWGGGGAEEVGEGEEEEGEVEGHQPG